MTHIHHQQDAKPSKPFPPWPPFGLLGLGSGSMEISSFSRACWAFCLFLLLFSSACWPERMNIGRCDYSQTQSQCMGRQWLAFGCCRAAASIIFCHQLSVVDDGSCSLTNSRGLPVVSLFSAGKNNNQSTFVTSLHFAVSSWAPSSYPCTLST